jgi:hypothetical protein
MAPRLRFPSPGRGGPPPSPNARIAAAERQAGVVLNLATGVLWGCGRRSRRCSAIWPPATARGAAADWQVGHFTGCLGAIRGAAGAWSIADTYASRLERHPSAAGQRCPPLRRDALPTSGGALVIVPSARAALWALRWTAPD